MTLLLDNVATPVIILFVTWTQYNLEELIMAEEDYGVTLGASTRPWKGTIETYKELAKLHEQNAIDFFDDAVKRSGIDVETNRETYKNFKNEKDTQSNLSKMLKKEKSLRVLIVFLIVIGLAVFVTGIYFISAAAVGTSGLVWAIILPVLGGGCFAFATTYLVKKVNPIILKLSKEHASSSEAVKNLENKSWREVAPLNNIFKDEDTFRLIERTMPEFYFEPFFSMDTYELFRLRFDYSFTYKVDSMVYETLSGKYNGNPFVFLTILDHSIGEKTYRGTKTIEWQGTEYSSILGEWITVDYSQTIGGTVKRPYPEFTYTTRLFYGSQAYPDLSFSRESNSQGNSSRSGNSEFKTLFSEKNVSNYMQFSEMFASAKNDYANLLTSSVGFGDDFSFQKNKRCSEVISNHIQNFKLRPSAERYRSMSYDLIKENFIAENKKYFKNLYFCFAPFFAIPAYREPYSEEPIHLFGILGNFTSFEHEVMSRCLIEGAGRDLIAPEGLATNTIIRTELVKKTDEGDLVKILVYGCAKEDRLDYVNARCDNGHYYDIPVTSVEYIPVTKESTIFVCKEDVVTPYKEESGEVTYHGLKAFVVSS